MTGLRPIRLVCTDRSAHPERELVVLGPRAYRPDLPPDAPYNAALGDAMNFGIRGGRVTVDSDGRRRVLKKTKADLFRSRDGSGNVVHVPACPSCGRAPRLAVDLLARAAEALAEGQGDVRRVVIDVSLLPA